MIESSACLGEMLSLPIGKTLYTRSRARLKIEPLPALALRLPMQQLLIGFTSVTWQDAVMYAVGLALIWLAVKKQYEPMLLLPIGFGAILVNLPLGVVYEHEGTPGFLKILLDAGITTELFPVLIFVAVGAMCDFKPLFKMPVMIFFGAAAQFGIFATLLASVPLPQPPVIRALTTARERGIKMEYHEIVVPKSLMVLFPIVVTFVAGFVAPI